MCKKIDELTDKIFSTITNGNTSGKISDLIKTCENIKVLLKTELDQEFTRGYLTAKTEIKKKYNNKTTK